MDAVAGTAGEGTITRFLRWWGAELRRFLPSKARLWLGIDRPGFEIDSDAPIETLADRRRPAEAVCILRMPSSAGLVRRIDMAAAALGDPVALEQAIGRFTPFRPGLVYARLRIVGPADTEGRVPVVLAAAPKSAVDPALARLREAGLEPERVVLESPDKTGTDELILVMDVGRRRLRAGLWLAMLLAAVALVSPFAKARYELALIETRLEAASAQAARLPLVEREANARGAAFEAAVDARAGRPAAVAVLEAVSRAIPDSAYLVQFELRGDSLALQGMAQSASDLVSALESLPMVGAVEYEAPVLRDTGGTGEQFHFRLALGQTAKSEAVQ